MRFFIWYDDDDDDAMVFCVCVCITQNDIHTNTHLRYNQQQDRNIEAYIHNPSKYMPARRNFCALSYRIDYKIRT